MKRKDFYSLAIGIIASISIFIVGCSENPVDPVDPGPVGAPTNVRVSLDAIPGGNSFAVVSWSHGANVTSSSFVRYKVSTYQVDANDVMVALLRVDSVANNQSTLQITLLPNTRYRSYIVGELTNDRRTDSVATPVYARVFVGEGAVLDEFTTTGASRSGFGWSLSSGLGERHPFTANSAPFIDLHMRDAGGLKFFSPHTQTNGTKNTLLGIVGEGQEAFRTLDLQEPALASVEVLNNTVYLLKTQEGFYVKIWVREIIEAGATQSYRSVRFDYKVQPISGLRALKG